MTFVNELARVVCSQIPERSLLVGGWQFPLCYRCMGIYGSIAVGLLLYALGLYRPITLRRLVTSLLVISGAGALLYLDAIHLQRLRPANDTRFASGVVFGLALSLLVFQSIRTLTMQDPQAGEAAVNQGRQG